MDCFDVGEFTYYKLDDGSVSVGLSGGLFGIYMDSRNHLYTYSNLVIPEKVKFEGKEYTVTQIINDGFCGCTEITSITIPDSVKIIGNFTFHNCYNLTSLTLSKHLYSIGQGAFCKCSALASVMLPYSLNYISSIAFGYCENLKHVYCEFEEGPFVEQRAFCDGPHYRIIHTKNNYIDIIPFCANKRTIHAKN